MSSIRCLLAVLAVLVPGMSWAQEPTVTYENGGWKVLRAMVGQKPACAVANTRPDQTAALLVMGQELFGAFSVYSPAWNFEKTTGRATLRGSDKDEDVEPKATYDGHSIYFYLGDDPQIPMVLLTIGHGGHLVVTGRRDEELTSFEMAGYEAAIKAYSACVGGLYR